MVLHIRKALSVRSRQIFEFVKDRAAIQRAKLCADRRFAALQVRVICATSHDDRPPSKQLVKEVVQAGSGSRMSVSNAINVLLQRLSKTKSWMVALKCLILLHRALQQGGFVYEDQLVLRFRPRSGAKNHLNLSRFRDRSSPLAWQASSWIRWYAGFLEALIKATADSFDTNRFSGLSTDEIIAGILALDAFLCEAYECPMLTDASMAELMSHALIYDAVRLVVKDCITKQDELHTCLKQISEARVNELTISQITEMSHMCDRFASRSVSSIKLRELAISMHLLLPQAHVRAHVFSAEQELLNVKAVFTAAALGASDAGFVMKIADQRKDVVPVVSLAPLKLSSAAEMFRASKAPGTRGPVPPAWAMVAI